MIHVISWSGGKDSTATVILFKEHMNELVKEGDKVVLLFSEVMFDLKKNISGHNPDVIKFIYEAKDVFESWGFEVNILRAEKDFLDFFHHKMRKSRKYPEHEGMTHGFPMSGICSVKRDLKLKPIEAWKKAHKDEPHIDYVGIAVDESDRLISLHKQEGTVSLLEKYGYTEQMARELCENYHLLSPQYSLSISQKRDGCWFCPWAKKEEHMAIAKQYPKAWKQYVELENTPNLAYPKWNPYIKQTLHERDEEIRFGYRQLNLFEYLKTGT